MKISYYPDTDSLYIDLSEQPSAESRDTISQSTCGTGVSPVQAQLKA
jgi:hypothetical protein